MTQMIEVKTAELSGAALDWAVAKVEAVDDLVLRKGRPAFERDWDPDCWADDDDIKLFKCWQFYSPSANWNQGGPLIEKHRVCLDFGHGKWDALAEEWVRGGASPLIAACRAIVASKLGDTVQIPAELLS